MNIGRRISRKLISRMYVVLEDESITTISRTAKVIFTFVPINILPFAHKKRYLLTLLQMQISI